MDGVQEGAQSHNGADVERGLRGGGSAHPDTSRRRHPRLGRAGPFSDSSPQGQGARGRGDTEEAIR